MKLLGRDSFSDWLGCWGIGSGFAQNLDLHMSGDFAVQLDGHSKIANAFERLVQLDLAAVHLEALGSEVGSDIR